MLTLFTVLTVILSQLHLLRNLTSLYVVAYFGCFAATMIVAMLTLRRIDRGSRFFLRILMIMFVIPVLAIIPGLISGEPYSGSALGMGIGRLMFTLPIFVVVLIMPRTEKNLRLVMLATCVLTVVAALTIPYQFATGPIAWFAESSERAGLIRFASLFGSLTTLGVVCGMGIVLCAYCIESPTLMTIAMLCIALGAVLSLSKAALVNVATGFIMLPFVRRTSRRDVIVFLLFLFIGLNIVVAMFHEQLQAFWLSFRLTDAGSSNLMDDVSLSESLVDRLTALPMAAIDFHGRYSVLLGVGPIGGAGTFGYPDAPFVHNGLVELLLVGGIPGLGWYLWIHKRLLRSGLAMFRSPVHRKEGSISLFIIASLFINSIFSSGMMFNPIGALLLAIAIKLLAPAAFTPPGQPYVAAVGSAQALAPASASGSSAAAPGDLPLGGIA